MILKRNASVLYAPSLLVLVVGVVAALVWYSHRNLFPFDDTFITFRYTDHVARGLGIVWNPGGPHTEGYTNFLLMIALVPFSLLHVDLVSASQAIGVICAIASGFVIYRLIVAGLSIEAGIPSEESSMLAILPLHIRLFGLFGALLYYLDPFTWMNAYSGLETSLFVSLLLLAVWLWARPTLNEKPSALRQALPFFAVFAAFLARPEGGLLALVLWVVGILTSKKGGTLGFVIGFVIPALIYLIWKQIYFGDVLPNSFYVKVAQPNTGGISPYQGGGTMKLFYIGVWYLALLSLFAFIGPRKNGGWHRRQIPLVALMWSAGLTLFYAFSLLLQPLYGRFTHSIEAMLIVSAAIGIARLYHWVVIERPDVRSNAAIRNLAFASSCLLLLGLHIIRAYSTRGANGFFAEDRIYATTYRTLGKIFHDVPQHDAITLAWGDAGVLPYYSGMRSIDVVGLNTNEIARARSTDSVLRIIARERPDLLMLPLEVRSDSSSAPDTCRSIIRWGHGLIGTGYWRLPLQPEFANYKSIALFKLGVYDLDLLADPQSPHYADLALAMNSRIGQPGSVVYAAPKCVR